MLQLSFRPGMFYHHPGLICFTGHSFLIWPARLVVILRSIFFLVLGLQFLGLWMSRWLCLVGLICITVGLLFGVCLVSLKKKKSMFCWFCFCFRETYGGECQGYSVLMLSKFSMSVRTLSAVEYQYLYPGYPHRSTIRASSSVKSLADCAKSVENF